ncbi:hypothetical protein V8E53_002593 [Lactarius tabidus]
MFNTQQETFPTAILPRTQWIRHLPEAPSATFQPKLLSSGLTKRTHALLKLIESERAYALDFALIRDIHLPVALDLNHRLHPPGHAPLPNGLSTPHSVV